MILDNLLYQLHGQAAGKYGNGIHTKHKHIKYHDFFCNRISENETVLDVGTNNGALTFDIANKSNAKVTGIEIIESNYKKALKNKSHPNITYLLGDALKDIPGQSFQVIVLSNVLEHIEHRVDFLSTLLKNNTPERFLIRVPLFERDWRVPLKKELGIDYRLDDTHYIEYTLENYEDEISKAGLKISHLEVRWGEIWSELKPQD